MWFGGSKLEGIGVIAGVCLLVLTIVLFKKNAQILFNFFVRIVVGAVTIFFLNDFFESQNVLIILGLNPVTLLTTGILGIPGVLLLYGIEAVNLLL